MDSGAQSGHRTTIPPIVPTGTWGQGIFRGEPTRPGNFPGGPTYGKWGSRITLRNSIFSQNQALRSLSPACLMVFLRVPEKDIIQGTPHPEGKFVFKDPRPIRVRPPPRPQPTLLGVRPLGIRGFCDKTSLLAPPGYSQRRVFGAREFSGGSQHGQGIFRGDPPMVSGVAE